MKPYRLIVYEDAAGEWRWRMRSPNGRIVADCAEGYVSRRNALRAARVVQSQWIAPCALVAT